MLNEIPAKALRNLFGSKISITQVLQAIASGMADCGVDVLIDPRIKVPCADPKEKKIWLPASVKSERALLVVSWFLDHEASHIIYTPDLRPVLDRWQKEGPVFDVCKAEGFEGVPDALLGATKGLLNMVEDSRIEHLMSKRLPGTKKHFLKGPTAAGIDDLMVEVLEAAKKMQAESGEPEVPLSPFWVGEMHAYCILDGWHGQKEKDYARKLLPKHVHWVMDIIDDEFGDIRDVTQLSFDGAVSRTESAMAKIIEIVLKDSEESDGEGDGEGEEGQSGSPFQNKFKKNKKSKKSKKGNKGEKESGKEDSEPEDSEGGEGDSEDDSDGSGESDASDGDDSMDDGGSGSKSGDNSDSGSDESESDGDGSGGSDGSDDPEESEETSDGDTGEEESDAPGSEDESGDGDPVEEEESQLDESEVGPKKLPKQVEEWAKDAEIDMADLIRAGGEAEGEGADGPGGSGERPTMGASPRVPHETSIAGMPDEYYNHLAPGLRSIVIEGVDLKALVSKQDEAFQIYDDFVKTLMPPNLGPAARKLVGKFKSAPGPAWSGNRVNPRMLQPIMSGKADGRPLFMRRNETVYSKKGVAAMLMLDCSGSMCDTMSGLNIPNPPGSGSSSRYGYRDFSSKFVISHAAIRSLARVFQSAGIAFAVGGFTGTDAKHIAGGAWGGNFSRYYDLVNFMFKDFHEPWTNSEQKMIAMNPFTSVDYKGDRICSHTNCDGESLLWAATRLLAREEDIKVLIVASDGLPAGGDGAMQTAFLKYVVKRLEFANIYVGALGIGNQGVKHYYRIHELVDHFPDGHGGPDTAPLFVQDKVIRLVDRLMVEGGNRNG